MHLAAFIFVTEIYKFLLNIFRNSDFKFFHLQIRLIFCNAGRRRSDETLSQYCYSYFWLSANPHSTLRARPGWKRQCNRASDWFQTKKLKNNHYKNNKSVCTVTGKEQSVCDRWACERACTCSVVVTDCWVWEEGRTCCHARMYCADCCMRDEDFGPTDATQHDPTASRQGEWIKQGSMMREWKKMREDRMRQIPFHQHI